MWYKIVQLVDWFGEMADRYRMIKNFNLSAKNAFINGEADTLLEAKITMGERSYKHAFSKFLSSGFRIKTLSGQPMSRHELIEVGQVILDNSELVRKLVALGWDTLEVHDDHGVTGCKWALSEYTKMGGLLK